MQHPIKLFLFSSITLFGQATVSQVNCPNPFTANQVILVQSIHVNPFSSVPAIILGCYQLDNSWVIDNTTTPPTIHNTGGSSGGINFADEETIGGTADGTNVTFTVAHSPQSGSLKVYKNGIRLQKGLDYNLSGVTITFVTLATPQTSDVLLCDYRY